MTRACDSPCPAVGDGQALAAITTRAAHTAARGAHKGKVLKRRPVEAEGKQVPAPFPSTSRLSSLHLALTGGRHPKAPHPGWMQPKCTRGRGLDAVRPLSPYAQVPPHMGRRWDDGPQAYRKS